MNRLEKAANENSIRVTHRQQKVILKAATVTAPPCHAPLPVRHSSSIIHACRGVQTVEGQVGAEKHGAPSGSTLSESEAKRRAR